MKGLLSRYLPSYPRTLVYMLQAVEYQPQPYLRWYWRTHNFRRVARRRQIEYTRSARLLVAGAWLLSCIFGLAVAASVWYAFDQKTHILLVSSLGLLLVAPVAVAHVLLVPLIAGRVLITGPKERALINASEKIFAEHPGVIIGVAGSYGKTTMKELLGTVLSEAKRVAVTPANKNVAVSHARFAQTLNGQEEVLVIEYGEAAPGDVARFVRTTHPRMGVITGIAPAHMEGYQSLESAAQDIFSLAESVERAFVNQDSEAAIPYIKSHYTTYDSLHAGDWQVVNINVQPTGLSFALVKGKQTITLQSKLLGRHLVGPLAATAVIGLSLGLTAEQVQAGIAKTEPFEHRMQPRPLNGALLIDDTYNGNIDGIKAGLALLKELPASRKLYVTPGLVEQGREAQAVHKRMAEYIADARPNIVVLMQNSATRIIQARLQELKFDGEVRIETEPLSFYENLGHTVAAGDIVLMQNDWTDNYA